MILAASGQVGWAALHVAALRSADHQRVVPQQEAVAAVPPLVAPLHQPRSKVDTTHRFPAVALRSTDLKARRSRQRDGQTAHSSRHRHSSGRIGTDDKVRLLTSYLYPTRGRWIAA